ncbi:MAG TPA: NADH-quinone oxidoreductase subunit NuoF [Candidatus Cloacimonas sp.]|jgi:NADH:ubiquinone oxidoreductase subunit F (NADH-binding)/(2Fe-2S) ferredoxin|nr:NADH-quinone oxidoreductase subunit NuoF [Candidatus Cloacimonas sp.]MDD2249521.1 NADH-quinone oxidoreductase subunit NuoF [Candidatus Cloacimonadota bacterium]MCK9164516.1 NADH-quinone oxidoreductase subunit NuoF [Candidatus Cloacimonas sp.]MDD3733381.1 NADH-quinone oxidoreductase subunit NuoF [Candidatus Cloacimonadota bacterium]MDD3868906.1 NADH-quinone oxidoreductase subunit NuoF [Candidatus Cloacimonadota bacterium]
MKYYRNHILVSINETSLAAGVQEFISSLRNELAKNDLAEEINILETGPLGFFGRGICLTVYPENINYEDVKIEDIPELVQEHFLKGRPLKRLMLGAAEKFSPKFNYENRIVLRNSGIIDPENIDDYIGTGGYEALEKALTQLRPEDVISEVKKSGLKGRGGAAFPVGLKWSFTAALNVPQKYVVVNADEGEPGTFKDRLIMEGDPHQLLEGVMLCAYAVGANKAYIYIRGEYKLCIARLENAIKQAYQYGILGKNIFDSGFDIDIEIKIGAGAYVCGEETALIESLEGNRGNPRWKPPFPGVEGLWKAPTIVNNVETLANVPFIIAKGAEEFVKYGTPECPGTKVYTILGDVAFPGLCEADMGTTLRTIINDYAGGMKKGFRFKAALVGGAAGVILPDRLLDVKMDFSSLNQYAAVLGSGAILVLNEHQSIIDLLWSILRFFRHESCGKCSPCRNGTEQLYKLISKIRKGNGTMQDVDLMLFIAETMQQTSFCALGQSPIMAVRSAIENFPDEFIELTKK